MEFKDVVKAFNRRYGKGTLVHPGMVDQWEGKNIVQFEDLDSYLGLDSAPVYHHDKVGHAYHEEED